MSQAIKVVIDPVIQRNAIFAHPENLLIGMVTDDRKHIRELGFRRILKARSVNTSGEVRQIQVPAVNFSAADYIYLIQWDKVEVTEPPILTNLSYNDLKMYIDKRDREDFISFAEFPYHAQSVERCGRVVTGAAVTGCGGSSMYGFIRSIMPYFETKSDFKVTKLQQHQE